MNSTQVSRFAGIDRTEGRGAERSTVDHAMFEPAVPPAVDVGIPARTIPSAREDADCQEQAWESEGGAIAGGSQAGLIKDDFPRPSARQSIGAGMHFSGDRPMTGTITDLRPGGFGFIASDAYGTPWRLPFRRFAVDGDGFIRLHVGQRVRFDLESIPGGRLRQHAVCVVPLD